MLNYNQLVASYNFIDKSVIPLTLGVNAIIFFICDVIIFKQKYEHFLKFCQFFTVFFMFLSPNLTVALSLLRTDYTHIAWCTPESQCVSHFIFCVSVSVSRRSVLFTGTQTKPIQQSEWQARHLNQNPIRLHIDPQEETFTRHGAITFSQSHVLNMQTAIRCLWAPNWGAILTITW